MLFDYQVVFEITAYVFRCRLLFTENFTNVIWKSMSVTFSKLIAAPIQQKLYIIVRCKFKMIYL